MIPNLGGFTRLMFKMIFKKKKELAKREFEYSKASVRSDI
jgi:hypothetical protein